MIANRQPVQIATNVCWTNNRVLVRQSRSSSVWQHVLHQTR